MRRQWSSMDNLMHRAVRRMDFAPRLEAAAVCQAALQAGKDQYSVVSYRGKTLKVSVTDYEQAAYLRPRLPGLINEINNLVGADAIKTIVIQVKPSIDK